MTAAIYITTCQRQTRPRLSTVLKLMFTETQAFGQPALWLGSVIELIAPFGFPERTIRTALFRLAERGIIQIERHGRRSMCMLTPGAATALLTARQRLNIPPARSFRDNWHMAVNSGGINAVRYAAVRKQLLEHDYCQLAPNLLARPASYGMPADDDNSLALFDVSGGQLASAASAFKAGDDLDAPAALYQQFLQRFQPLQELLARRSAFSDEQAYLIRVLLSQGYQQCRRSDPLLPQELLPENWPAMAAYQTYVTLYAGCALQAQRRIIETTQRECKHEANRRPGLRRPYPEHHHQP